jgi:hypothetical protein
MTVFDVWAAGVTGVVVGLFIMILYQANEIHDIKIQQKKCVYICEESK